MSRRVLSVLALATCVIGCGGSDDDSSNPPPPPRDASPGGIWEGSASTGAAILGLVTEDGEFHFLQDDGVQYFGIITTSRNDVSGDFVGVTQFGTAFADGSVTGSGTLTGSLSERRTFEGSATFRTQRGSRTDSTITLNYNDLYERNSSLALIAGNYRDPDSNAVINVDGNGVVFSQDAGSGCVINGKVEIIDPDFNAYRVEYRFSSCIGASATLNGTVAEGLGLLDNTVTPERAIIGVTNSLAGYALTGFFPRT